MQESEVSFGYICSVMLSLQLVLIILRKTPAIHDFNALRPPQFTCCEPNCRRTFAAEETYREHWARNHHLHGDGTPNGIVDVHLLLIDPKGCHAARCFLAMQGGGDPLNSIR